jgi:putative oxidoreductase
MTSSKEIMLYRAAKVFISFFMLFSAFYSFTHAADLRLLGFPDYFRIELVVAKVIGATLLLVPQVSLRIKEWIYAGFGIAMSSALIAHICSHDPLSKIIFVLIDIVLIATCVQYVHRKDHPEIKQVKNI